MPHAVPVRTGHGSRRDPEILAFFDGWASAVRGFGAAHQLRLRLGAGAGLEICLRAMGGHQSVRSVGESDPKFLDSRSTLRRAPL